MDVPRGEDVAIIVVSEEGVDPEEPERTYIKAAIANSITGISQQSQRDDLIKKPKAGSANVKQ